jgi:hypothetical protein
MECLNCKIEVSQSKGKRAKLYCSEKCRIEYFRKKKGEGKPKRGPGRPRKVNLAALAIEVEKETEKRSNPFINAARGRDANGVNQDEADLAQKEGLREDIEEQIKVIKAEKIPDNRNTFLGRKSWILDQKKRIEELQTQLK